MLAFGKLLAVLVENFEGVTNCWNDLTHIKHRPLGAQGDNMQNTLHLAAPRSSANLQTNSMLAASKWWDRNGQILHPTIRSFVFQNTLPPPRTPRHWCGIGQLQAMPCQALATVQLLFRHQHIPLLLLWWKETTYARHPRFRYVLSLSAVQLQPIAQHISMQRHSMKYCCKRSLAKLIHSCSKEFPRATRKRTKNGG